MQELVTELHQLEEKLKQGGGKQQADAQHLQHKLTARERIDLLVDPETPLQEIGLLIGHDCGPGHTPGGGVVTVIARIEGRPAVIVANDPTVDGGAWNGDTVHKILRAQEIAMRCRIPVVYLVDAMSSHTPDAGGVFPGEYGAARVYYHSALMRRKLRVAQIAAVLGPCVGASALLAALSDVILMAEKNGSLSLTEGNGRNCSAEMHTRQSGVAHYTAADDEECLQVIRQKFREFAPPIDRPRGVEPPKSVEGIGALMPEDHRKPYEIEEVLARVFDGDDFLEFQAEYAPEILCANARLNGRAVALIANRRGVLRAAGNARVGGVLYPESAKKVAYFIENAERNRWPLLYLQDVSGFLPGAEANSQGIIREVAQMIESMACTTVPKIVLTLNHAIGGGYHAMAGQGFDPDLTFAWPTARIGAEDAADRSDLLDAKFAAARGHVDAIIDPRDTRAVLDFALEVTACGSRAPLVLETL